MAREYTEDEKTKYCRGFKNSTLPITDYAEKMELDVENLKAWLKDYKEPLPYGAITLSNLLEQPKEKTIKTSFRFETDGIKVEIAENHDKELLNKVLDLLAVMCSVK